MNDNPIASDPPERPSKWKARPSPFASLPFEGEWPAVLPKLSSDTVLPLALGIHEDLMLRLDESQWPALKTALKFYCNGPAYLRACSDDSAMRHDVDGRPTQSVSESDRLTAAIRLLVWSLHKAHPEHAAKAKPLLDRAKKIVGRAAQERAEAVQKAVEASPATSETAASGAPGAPMVTVTVQPPTSGRGGRPVLSLKRA